MNDRFIAERICIPFPYREIDSHAGSAVLRSHLFIAFTHNLQPQISICIPGGTGGFKRQSS